MTYAAVYASAAPVPQGFGRVTVTITPTILVSTNSEGDPVTVGTITPTPEGAAESGFNALTWIPQAVLVLLAAFAWWLASRDNRRDHLAAGTRRTSGATAAAQFGDSEEADSDKPDFGKPDLDKPDGEEPDHGGPERRIQRSAAPSAPRGAPRATSTRSRIRGIPPNRHPAAPAAPTRHMAPAAPTRPATPTGASTGGCGAPSSGPPRRGTSSTGGLRSRSRSSAA